MRKNYIGSATIFESIVSLIILAILTSVIFLTYRSITKPVKITEENALEANGPVLSMIPSILISSPGSNISIDLMIDTKAEKASAADIIINYNPAVLKANSITVADSLPVTLKAGLINNGTITITLGSQPTTPKFGIGKLATINFTVLTYGADTISYSAQTQLAVLSQTSSFVGSLAGSIITIPTPTTIPSSTPIPLPTLPWSTPVPTEVTLPTATSVPQSTPTPIPTVTPTAGGSVVIVYAAGTKAGHYPYYPNMKLVINDHAVLEALSVRGNPSIRQFVKYTYYSSDKVEVDQVKIKYTNDYHRGREDRNLMVDKIEIDGVTYQTEANNVYTKSARHTGCHSGFRSKEWLYCNGYFAY